MTLLGQCLLLLANNIPLVKPLPLVYELPMLSEFFESRVRIQALRDGPAGSLLESFAQALSEAGYVRRIARRLSLPKTLSACPNPLIGKLIEARGHLEAAKQLWSESQIGKCK